MKPQKALIGTIFFVVAGLTLTSCRLFGWLAPPAESEPESEVVVTVAAPIVGDEESEPDDTRSGVLVAQAAPDSDLPVQATLTAEHERVEIRRSSDSRYVSLRLNQSVFVTSGDVIRTGSSGSAKLVFLDNTETTLFPNTVVVVDTFSQQSGGAYTIKMIQLIGTTFNRANFANAGSTQKVETPYGVASVRGTGYWVEVVITGPLAATLLTQELEAFETQIESAIVSGDLSALIDAITNLLGATPGTVSVDVGAGTITFSDGLGNVVTVASGSKANSGTSSSGNPIVVTIQTTDRLCGDDVCDPYLGESAATCARDC
jgi:hypothetical protein